MRYWRIIITRNASTMKRLLIGFIVLGSFAIALPASAQVGMMNNYRSTTASITAANTALSAALQDVSTRQGVSSVSQLTCSKITDDQFETIGDAYMGTMFPSEAQHQAMEQVMGGEGSASLRQAHITMGRAYLGCWSGYASGPVYMPMMGGYGASYGMMGWNAWPDSNDLPSDARNWGFMMDSPYGSSWLGWITTVLLWVLLVAGIVAAVQWIRKH